MEKFFDNFLNFIILLMISIIAYALFSTPTEPQVSPIEKDFAPEKIADPIQTRYSGDEYISISLPDTQLRIYPHANYRIYAMVVSKKGYNFGWESKIAPYDLALVWSGLMLPENQRGIRYSQSNRWYFYRYDAGYPLAKSYIRSHSSNHHMIPANDNLKNALKSVKVKDKIYMEGYLVNIKGTVKGRNVWWNTSMSRNDSGDGACEILYLKKAVIDGRIYE